jgi:hypothetical protein
MQRFLNLIGCLCALVATLFVSALLMDQQVVAVAAALGGGVILTLLAIASMRPRSPSDRQRPSHANR